MFSTLLPGTPWCPRTAKRRAAHGTRWAACVRCRTPGCQTRRVEIVTTGCLLTFARGGHRVVTNGALGRRCLHQTLFPAMAPTHLQAFKHGALTPVPDTPWPGLTDNRDTAMDATLFTPVRCFIWTLRPGTRQGRTLWPGRWDICRCKESTTHVYAEPRKVTTHLIREMTVKRCEFGDKVGDAGLDRVRHLCLGLCLYRERRRRHDSFFYRS